jgi:hypothetical protein
MFVLTRIEAKCLSIKAGKLLGIVQPPTVKIAHKEFVEVLLLSHQKPSIHFTQVSHELTIKTLIKSLATICIRVRLYMRYILVRNSKSTN